MLTTAILHNDHFIDLLLFDRMSFHGLEHFGLVSVIDKSIIAGTHSVTLRFVYFPCCLWTTEVTSVLTLEEIVCDNLLFSVISRSRIFNSLVVFLRFKKVDMHVVLRSYLIHVLFIAHLGKAWTLFRYKFVELRSATVEGLHITVFLCVVPLLILLWFYFFIHFVGGNLLTFYIFWLTVISQPFVLRMIVASYHIRFTLSTRQRKICWSTTHSVDAQFLAKIIHLSKINSLWILRVLILGLKCSIILASEVVAIVTIVGTDHSKVALASTVGLNVSNTTLWFNVLLLHFLHFRIYPVSTLHWVLLTLIALCCL